ncbi:MAG: hypothetical protein II978_03545 [Clostridia bacterium]|nr:hypothetical protein [Clostridia bacterium]
MRKGMKLLAAIVAASVVSTMSISAFGLSYNTETTYDDGTVSVTTTVTLAEQEKDDEIAYLVYAGNEANSTTIKYIDQKNANGASSLTFDWTTTDATINANAYVGTTDTAASAAENEGKNNLVKVAGYNVTYSVEGNGVVIPDSELSSEIDGETGVAVSGTLSNVAEGVFHVFPEPGYRFTGVEGATATASDGGVTQTISFTADATIKFVFEEDTNAATLTAPAGAENDKVEAESVYKIAKATGALTEAGILVATTDEAKTALSAYVTAGTANRAQMVEDGIYIMKAWQIGSEGIYAVKVNDAAITEDAAVAAYAVGKNGTCYVAD